MKTATLAGRKSPPRISPLPPTSPRLRLTPYAWAKLVYLRDLGDTEIGGFGISTVDDPLLIQDVSLVAQRCDWANVTFEGGAVADLFDRQVDLGRRPEEFGRVWVHTHPGQSPQPSATDEETLGRVFGRCDWAVMFILARGGMSYARLRFGVGPGGELVLPVEVDFDAEFPATDRAAWRAEYDSCVEPMSDPWTTAAVKHSESFDWEFAEMLRA